MKATEFCKFFEFDLEKGEFKDEDGVNRKYCAIDDQDVFGNRYADNVSDLADAFDICIPDYVDEELEYNGFNPKNHEPSKYYLEANKWCKQSEINDTDLHHVVRVLAGLEELEEDDEYDNT